jgi:phosphoribosylamine-glycine ligase
MSVYQVDCYQSPRISSLSNHYASLIDVCATHPTHSLEVVSEQPGNNWLETNKSKAYEIFMSYGVNMPPCICYFGNDQELVDNLPLEYPYVVKFDNFSHVGLQTQVLRSASDLKWIYKYKKIITNLKSTGLDIGSELNGMIQKFISASYEYTVTILMNEKNWQTVGTANDYKKLLEGNSGPNTNSMGSIAPAKNTHPETNNLIDKIVTAIRNNTDYRGFVSCQFMVDQFDTLWFLETNFRLCNPEFQSMAAGLDCSLLDRIAECLENNFIQPVANSNDNAVTVVLMPSNWHQTEIKFEYDIQLNSDVFKIYNSLASSGTISITNHDTSRTHDELAAEIYQYLDTVDITGCIYRKDIGQSNG